MLKKSREILILTLTFALVTSVFSINNYAQNIKQKNILLVNASSPFEDLTEYALAGNIKEMTKSINFCKNKLKKVKHILKSNDYKKLENIIKDAQKFKNAGEYSNVALAAVDGYKILISELNRQGSVVPKQVSLMDYTGFKAKALLGSKNIGWKELLNNANEAGKLWSEIQHGVKSPGLHDAVNTAIKGMKESAIEKNVTASKLSAEMNLDLVDLLEGYFNKGK